MERLNVKDSKIISPENKKLMDKAFERISQNALTSACETIAFQMEDFLKNLGLEQNKVRVTSTIDFKYEVFKEGSL